MQTILSFLTLLLFMISKPSFSSVLATYEGRIGKSNYAQILPKLHHRAGDLKRVAIRGNKKAHISYFDALLKAENLGDEHSIVLVPHSVKLANNLALRLSRYFNKQGKSVVVKTVTYENTALEQSQIYQSFMQEGGDPMMLISIHLPGVENYILSEAKAIYLMRHIPEPGYLAHLLKHGFIKDISEEENPVWHLYDIGGNNKQIRKIMEYDLLGFIQVPYVPKERDLKTPELDSHNARNQNSKNQVEMADIGAFEMEEQDYFRAPNPSIEKILAKQIKPLELVTIDDIDKLDCIYDHIPAYLKESQQDLCSFVFRSPSFGLIKDRVFPVVGIPNKKFDIKKHSYSHACYDMEWIRPKFSKAMMSLYTLYSRMPYQKKMTKTLAKKNALKKEIEDAGYNSDKGIFDFLFLSLRLQSTPPENFRNSFIGSQFSDTQWATSVYGYEYLLPQLHEIYENVKNSGSSLNDLAEFLSIKEMAFLFSDLTSIESQNSQTKNNGGENSKPNTLKFLIQFLTFPNIHPEVIQHMGRVWKIREKIAKSKQSNQYKGAILSQLKKNGTPVQEFNPILQLTAENLEGVDMPFEYFEKIASLHQAYFNYLTSSSEGMRSFLQKRKKRENIAALIYPIKNQGI